MVYGTPVATSSTGRPGSERDSGTFNRGRIYDRTRRSNHNDNKRSSSQKPSGEALELLYRSSAIDTIVFNDDYDTSGGSGGGGGWKPGTFRSSRTDKAVRGNNSNETGQNGLGLADLMDTEDLAEYERRRELVPVQGRYLTQMLTGAGTIPGAKTKEESDILMVQFALAKLDLGSRGLGYGVILAATPIVAAAAAAGSDASVNPVSTFKKRPLTKDTDKKRMKLSISSSYGEDDDDEDTISLRPKKLRTLGTFTASGSVSINNSKPITGNGATATAGRIKFVGKSQRTAGAAALAAKAAIAKASTETIIFVRADSDLLVYTTTDCDISPIIATASTEKPQPDTKDVKPAATSSDRSSTPLVDTTRPEYQFLSQLSEELANRFHTATASAPGSDAWADPKVNSAEPAREVKPYVFNPLLLKRFGIKNPSGNHRQQRQDKLEEAEKLIDQDAVNNNTHVNLHRNEIFLRKPANRDLFDRIFG